MEDKSVGDQQRFLSLIRPAQEESAVKHRILAILRQPAFHRKSRLNTMIAELKMQSAPADFIQVIGCLKNDDVARKARELLEKRAGPLDGVVIL